MKADKQIQFTRAAIAETLARTLIETFRAAEVGEIPLSEPQQVEMVAAALRSYHEMMIEASEIIYGESEIEGALETLKALQARVFENFENEAIASRKADPEWATEEESQEERDIRNRYGFDRYPNGQ
jgi:hypothetical protein